MNRKINLFSILFLLLFIGCSNNQEVSNESAFDNLTKSIELHEKVSLNKNNVFLDSKETNKNKFNINSKNLHLKEYKTSTYIKNINTRKNIDNIFIKAGNKYNVNPKTLKAICEHESKNNPYVINVNKSTKDFIGSHKFKTDIETELFMKSILEPIKANYDIGYCQINSYHLKNGLTNSKLLDIEKNIMKAADIYSYGVNICKKNSDGNLLKCALSVYNSGKSHKKSSLGNIYANKVIKIINKGS